MTDFRKQERPSAMGHACHRREDGRESPGQSAEPQDGKWGREAVSTDTGWLWAAGQLRSAERP